MRNKLLKSWLFALTLLMLSCNVLARDTHGLPVVDLRNLPPEARETLDLIKRGGPFPYAKDGATFGNYERVLPKQNRGYYHEYTVPTPRVRNRGARRIVVGGEPTATRDLYYTGDHYQTFQRIKE